MLDHKAEIIVEGERFNQTHLMRLLPRLSGIAHSLPFVICAFTQLKIEFLAWR